MLCSLPNSSPRIWFLLFVLRGWPATFHAAQSVPLLRKKKGGRPYGSHFYMLFGMTRLQGQARAGPAQKSTSPFIRICSGKENERLSGLQQTACERCCQLPLALEVAPALLDTVRVLQYFSFFSLTFGFPHLIWYYVSLLTSRKMNRCLVRQRAYLRSCASNYPYFLKHSEIISEQKCLMINANKCQPCIFLACLPFPVIHWKYNWQKK